MKIKTIAAAIWTLTLTVFDIFLSRLRIYRRICGGIWRYVNIVENPEYAKGFTVRTWHGWVREDWGTTKKYWTSVVEVYDSEKYETAKAIKSFKHKFM